MSTISRAIEKNNSQYNTYPVDALAKDDTNLKLKMALFAALFVVIALLTVITFVLVNPLDNEQELANTEVIIEPTVVVEKPTVVVQAQPEKPVSRIKTVSFSVKPLPAPKQEAIQYVSSNSVVKPKQESRQTAMVEQKTVVKEIDYGDTSSDLQERFQSALLMLDELEEVEEPLEQPNRNDDGSDIHQMNNEFQSQVPYLQYDFHMYSSNQEERWIRINGEDLREGDVSYETDIEVLEIKPNSTLFSFEGQSFSLESLTNWEGY